MPSEPVSSYLDKALAAAARDKWNRAPENLEPQRREELEGDIRRIEPFIREQVQADLREALLSEMEELAQIAEHNAQYRNKRREYGWGSSAEAYAEAMRKAQELVRDAVAQLDKVEVS